jgi:hypothetical protein
MTRLWAGCWFAIALAPWLLPAQVDAAVFDVKSYGAKGDGKALDSPAINQAIEAAAAAGGGTVHFPAGTYVTGSIRLRSNLALQFEPGTTLEASADPAAYDAAEPNQWDKFQDFGHSHFHNSLIWGENSGERRHHRRRPASPARRSCANAARRATKPSLSSSAATSPARFLHPQRRPLRHPGHRRRQPHHRQRHHRHQP